METVLIIDFGGQYKELIARRVRECGVYSLIKPNTVTPEAVREIAPVGIIFTGGPNSVYAENAPSCAPEILELGVPVLGICYGMQLLAHLCGGKVGPCDKSEYGVLTASLGECVLFDGCAGESQVLMSHTDRVMEAPEATRNGRCVHSGTRNRNVHDPRVPFADLSCAMGYADVQMIDTTNGMFMTRKESKRLMLQGSTFLIGRK